MGVVDIDVRVVVGVVAAYEEGVFGNLDVDKDGVVEVSGLVVVGLVRLDFRLGLVSGVVGVEIIREGGLGTVAIVRIRGGGGCVRIRGGGGCVGIRGGGGCVRIRGGGGCVVGDGDAEDAPLCKTNISGKY